MTQTTPVNADDFLNLLNTFGVQWINKADLYAYFSGNKDALNKYQGDTPDDMKRRIVDAMENPEEFNSWLKEHPNGAGI